jgi:hypothetical protein
MAERPSPQKPVALLFDLREPALRRLRLRSLKEKRKENLQTINYFRRARKKALIWGREGDVVPEPQQVMIHGGGI